MMPVTSWQVKTWTLLGLMTTMTKAQSLAGIDVRRLTEGKSFRS